MSKHSKIWSAKKKNWIDGPKLPLEYAFLDTFAMPISRTRILFVGVASTSRDTFIRDFGEEIFVKDFPILKDKVLLYNFGTKKWTEQSSIPFTGNSWINKISCSIFFTKANVLRSVIVILCLDSMFQKSLTKFIVGDCFACLISMTLNTILNYGAQVQQ